MRFKTPDRIKNESFFHRVSVRVIHTRGRESVFMITSNTEAVEVVYCGQCGEPRFSANMRGFGCGAVRGKQPWVIPPFPHAPYTPQRAHCIHNRSPQIVDNVGIVFRKTLQNKFRQKPAAGNGCFKKEWPMPFSFSRLPARRQTSCRSRSSLPRACRR